MTAKRVDNNSKNDVPSKAKMQRVLSTSVRKKRGYNSSYLKQNNDSISDCIKTLTRYIDYYIYTYIYYFRNCPKNDLIEVSSSYARQASKLTFSILSDFSQIKLGRPLMILHVFL